MNLLDRAIALFSPEAAMRRDLARRYIRLAYEGASAGRRFGSWLAGRSSANAEIGSSLFALRDRSHALVRDNPYAARALNEFADIAVGTGITARASGADEGEVARINTAWANWIEDCDADGQLDLYGLQGLAAKTVFESGECLVRLRQRRNGDGHAVPLQLQLLEPDYLDHNKTGLTQTGYIIQGVEFDAIGRRVAYWLYPGHPGDVIRQTRRGSAASAPVPAEDILHVYRKTRPGQVRGVPWLSPVMVLLHDLDGYEDAELMRKRVEACFVAFVSQPEGMEGPTLAPSTVDEAGRKVEQVEPGQIKYLTPGASVSFGSPHSQGGYREYVRARQGTIAAALSMMAPQLTGDYSEINYTSFKAGFLAFRAMIETFRWACFVPMFCEPIWRRFHFTWLTVQGREVEKAPPANWTPPGFGSVEPYRDAMAALTYIRSGIRTLPQAIAEQGYDPASQLREIAEFNALLDKLQITLDCDPRKVTQSGAEQAGGKPVMEGK